MTNKLTENNNNNNNNNNNYYDEDELDLTEILTSFFHFIIRRKKEILVVTLVTTMLFLGAALYIRKNTHDKHEIEFSLIKSQSLDYLKGSGLSFQWQNLEQVLSSDEFVEEVFKNSIILEVYNGEESIIKKREFLSERIDFKWGQLFGEKGKMTQDRANVILNFQGRSDISQIILNSIIEVYNNVNLKELYEKLAIRKKLIEEEINSLETELKKKTQSIQEIMTREFQGNYQEVDVEKIMTIKYGERLLNYNIVKSQYEKYIKQRIAIETLKKEKGNTIIIASSPLKTVERNSKFKFVPVIGMILGLILGILYGVLKDILENIKKEEKKEENNQIEQKY